MKTKKPKKKETIAEALKNNPQMKNWLASQGMHCADCPFAMYETYEEGAALHGIKPKKPKAKN